MKTFYIILFIGFLFAQPNLGSSTSLDIMTWNIENFPKQNNATVDYVTNFLLASNIDIVALQEISSRSYFELLIDNLNLEDDTSSWMGYRAGGNSSWMENAYIVRSDEFSNISEPFEIFHDEGYAFPREPYVLSVEYNEENFILINNHLKCCDGEGFYRRQLASILLQEYIEEVYPNDKVIVLGDLNDEIQEPQQYNAFWNFIDSPDFLFTDMGIAEGSLLYWSYPMFPSHLDHILVSNELFSAVGNVETILYDDYMDGGWEEYDINISDHRPVYISILGDFDLGDINNDGEVDILDIVLMVDWILSPYDPSEDELAIGDLSGDGSIDVLDVVALVELIVNSPAMTQLTVYVQGFYEQNLLTGTSTVTIGDSTFTTENGMITVTMPQGTYEFNATNPNTWDNLAFWNDDYLGMSDEQTSRPYEMRHGDDHLSPITLDQEVQNVYANKIDLTYPFGETFMDLGPQVVAYADPSPLVVNTSYEIPDETRTGWLNDYVTDVSAIPHAENLISEIQYLAEMPETPHTWVAFSNDFPPPGTNNTTWDENYEIIEGHARYPLWPSKYTLYIEIFQAMFRGIDDPAVLYNNGGDDVGFNARGNRDITFSSFWGNGFWVTTPDQMTNNAGQNNQEKINALKK
jgi:endonuclease/exonuclease/phosphatase family metal-dependent hydrolase